MKVLIVDDEPLAREELHYLIQGNSEVTEILEADGIFMAEEQVIPRREKNAVRNYSP